MKLFFSKILSVFFVLGILFIPLNFDGKGIQIQISEYFFRDLVLHIQELYFGNAIKNIDFSSDTIALNILLVVLLAISILLIFCLFFLKIKSDKIIAFARIIITYYLVFVLLKYGFNKVFKTQFYLPEPNILYSKFGDLSKDILFWSTMGTSRFYSISLGSIEVFTAVLILINRTRVVGFLIAIGIFVNVVIINFGFDISVKTYSLFLLFANFYVVFPYLKSVLAFFVLGKQVRLQPCATLWVKNPFLESILKICSIAILFFYVLNPYLYSGNTNDDIAERPFLHGVYKINQIFIDGIALEKNKFPLKNIFIHRNNYLIFQQQNDQMRDCHFEIDKSKNTINIADYQSKTLKINYVFNSRDSILELHFYDKRDWFIVCKSVNWRKMPALLDDFHFTIDEIK